MTTSGKSSEAVEKQISILMIRIAGTLGAACALLGIVAIAPPGDLPLQLHTALGFLLCGAAIVSLTLKREKPAGVLAIGTMALATLALGMTGGMPPNTAACFFFSGLALLLASRQRGTAFMGILGSVEAALAFIPLVGFLTGGDIPPQWGDLSHMAPLSAAGLLGLGLALLALAWSRSTRKSFGGPPWAKYAVTIGVFSLSLIQWHVLGKQERDSLNKTIQRETRELRTKIVSGIEPKILALLRMAERWEAFDGMPRTQWNKDASLYVAHNTFEAVHWVDSSFKPRWSVTKPGRDHYDLSDEMAPFILAEMRPKSVMTLRLSRADKAGPRKLLVLRPLNHGGHPDGMLVGVLDIDTLIGSISKEQTRRGYSVALFDGARAIYGPASYPHHLSKWIHQERITPFNLSWTLRIWPRQEKLAGMRSPLPGVVLGVGLLTAFLLGLTVHLAQSERIKASELEKTNRGLSAEVTRRKRAELELRDNRDRLEEMVLERTSDLEAAQRQLAEKEALAAVGSMAAVMAHEIRNPLGSIVTAAKSLVKGSLSAGDKKTLISVLGHETNRLDKTLRDFLFYARPRDPKLSKSDLNSTAREILGAIKSDKRLLGEVAVTTDLDKNLNPFAFDQDQVRQVLWNLIINALQAMAGKGRLTVTTRSNHGKAVFTVADSGPGIPADAMEKIFQPFHTTKQQGNGLGLAIALRIVRAHGGRIEVDGNPGKGARFSVYLPTSPTA